MSEENLLLRRPPPKKPFNWDRFISIAAVVAACGTIFMYFLQYTAASHQAAIAKMQLQTSEQARRDAKEASDAQTREAKEAKQAAKDSADYARRLADGMERSARAAEKSAGIARDASNSTVAMFKFEQRPLLSLSEFKATWSKGTQLDVSAMFSNTGKTEAIEVRRTIEIFAGNIRVATTEPAALPVVSLYMHPTYTLTAAFTAQQVAAINAGTQPLRIKIRLQYKNTFGDAQPAPQWCHEYNSLKPAEWILCDVQ
jgi:hypothetical protein